MKSKLTLFGIIFLALAQISNGQGAIGVDNGALQLSNSIDQMNTGKRQIVSAYIKNPPRKVLGSYYVFDDWKNKGIIQVSDDKGYKIGNININVKDGRFEAQAGKDSIFTFNTEFVDFFLINNKKYKDIYLDKFKQSKICEIILEDEAYTVLKVYHSDVKKNDPDPLMLKPDADEYVVSSHYYIKRGGDIEKFRLNRKQVIGLFADHKKLMESYVKEHKLSYNKAEHLKKMYNKWKTL